MYNHDVGNPIDGKRDTTMGKCLVAYFSRRGSNYVNGKIVDLKEGNTEYMAKMIQGLTDADIFEIKPVKPYPDDYRQTAEVATLEKLNNIRPQLAAVLKSADAYDTLLLGYPNWCGTMPMAVFTFLDMHGWAGKIIMPFCTNEGSGMGHSEDDLKKMCPYATITPGLEVPGHLVHESKPRVIEWLTANGVQVKQ